MKHAYIHFLVYELQSSKKAIGNEQQLKHRNAKKNGTCGRHTGQCHTKTMSD